MRGGLDGLLAVRPLGAAKPVLDLDQLIQDRVAQDEADVLVCDQPPLRPEPGQKIELRYFEPDIEGRLQEKTATFRFRGSVPLQADETLILTGYLRS